MRRCTKGQTRGDGNDSYPGATSYTQHNDSKLASQVVLTPDNVYRPSSLHRTEFMLASYESAAESNFPFVCIFPGKSLSQLSTSIHSAIGTSNTGTVQCCMSRVLKNILAQLMRMLRAT